MSNHRRVIELNNLILLSQKSLSQHRTSKIILWEIFWNGCNDQTFFSHDTRQIETFQSKDFTLKGFASEFNK